MSESKMLSNVRPRGQKDLSTVKADPEPDYSKSRVLPLSPESALKKIQFEERFKAGDWNADINSSLGADRRALVVSISYGSRSPPSPLQGTYTDAQIIIDLLVQKFDYLESEIHVLADVLVIGDDHKRDESRLPSQKNIENALNWLNRGSKEGDYRFLFFAGHGYRRIESPPGYTYEGIMPEDIQFIPYQPCPKCNREPEYQPSFLSGQGQLVIPHQALIMWDYALNEILASTLADGAKLTVLFDCCHSGGTLSKSFVDPDNVLARSTARGSGPSYTGSKLDSLVFRLGCALSTSYRLIYGPSESQVDSRPRGNFLRLPKHIPDLQGEPDQAMDMTQPQGDPVPSSICHACGPHRLDKPKIVEFQPNCQVLCWAACSAIQKAEEDEYAGRFTRAFVEHLAVSGRETTYKALNRHILEKFDVHNWDKPENEFQVPQLYTSANMEDDFEREIDI